MDWLELQSIVSSAASGPIESDLPLEGLPLQNLLDIFSKDEGIGELEGLKKTLAKELAQRLELSDAASVIERFIQNAPIAKETKRAAEWRRSEILRGVADSERESIVKKQLDSVNSLAELDAIENVLGLLSLSTGKFEQILLNDLKAAKESTREIVFGVKYSEELVDRIIARHEQEKLAVLNIVYQMALCANDTTTNSDIDPGFSDFAVSFIDQVKSHLRSKVIHYLQERQLTGPLLNAGLNLLFALSVHDVDVKFGTDVISLARFPSYSSHVGYIACVIQICLNLREEPRLTEVVSKSKSSIITFIWASVTGNRESFSKTYVVGLEFLDKLVPEEQLNIVLKDFLLVVFGNFGLEEFLESVADCSYFAKLWAAPFYGRNGLCDDFWDDSETYAPLNSLLNRFAVLASESSEHVTPHLELCASLIASEESALSCLEYLQGIYNDESVFIQNLLLYQQIFTYIDEDSLREDTDVTSVLRKISRNRHTPHFLSSLNAIALKFPQQVLTVCVINVEKDHFSLLQDIKQSLDGDHSTGSYSNLIPGLELLGRLVHYANREQSKSDLQILLPYDSIDFDTLVSSLRDVGYSGDIVDSVSCWTTKHGKVDVFGFEELYRNQDTALFRSLSLSLHRRRIQVAGFVAQAVKLAEEIYRSHGNWRFMDVQEKWIIGEHVTNIIHTCVDICDRGCLCQVKRSVIDDIMNDSSTQGALVANIVSLHQSSRHTPSGKELAFSSLKLLLSLLKLDTYYPQKVALLCHSQLVTSVAKVVGNQAKHHKESSLLCEVALEIMEQIIITLEIARNKLTIEGVPSIVALLSSYPFFQEDFAVLVERQHLSVFSLLNTALEFEPGLISTLLKQESILKGIMNLLADDLLHNKPQLYFPAIEFLRILWYKGYASTIDRLHKLFPDLWSTITNSLTVDISSDTSANNAELTKVCFQLNIRASALDLVTLELETQRLDKGFIGVLISLRKDRDSKWLEQYSKLPASHQMEELRLLAKQASIDLEDFKRVYPSIDDKPRPLFDRRARLYGVSFLYNTESITDVVSDEFIQQIKSFNCIESLAESQLSLFRAWKKYTEQCILFLDDADSPSELIPSPDFCDSTVQTLVSRVHEAELSSGPYLGEVSELLVTMLHFIAFERDFAGTETGFSSYSRPAELVFRRRINSSTSVDIPKMQKWVSSCLLRIADNRYLESVIISLLTSLTIFLELDASKTDHESIVVIISKVLALRKGETEVFDLCVPLLNTCLLHVKSHVALKLLDTFKLLYDEYRTQSGLLQKRYVEEQDLLLWLEKHGLSDLRVKVLVNNRIIKPQTENSQSELSRVHELSKQLGYNELGARIDMPSTALPFSDTVLQEFSITRLLFDYGITSIEAFKLLDHHSLSQMGISKSTDRRQLIDVIGSGEKTQKALHVSRSLGYAQQHSMFSGLSRMHAILQVLCAAVGLDTKTVGDQFAGLNIIGTFARDPLFIAVGGSWFQRGYTVQGERDAGHLVWCQCLRLTELLIAGAGTQNVDQALDLVVAHAAPIRRCLEASNASLTVGMLDELIAVTGLLRELTNYTSRWRLRSSIFKSLIDRCLALIPNLAIGHGTRRKLPFLEEFAHFVSRPGKYLPELCINSLPITIREQAQAHEQAILKDLKAPNTPRLALFDNHFSRSDSVISVDCAEDEQAASPIISRRTASVLHLRIEYMIARVLQHLLSMFKNRQIVKTPTQLQVDEHTGHKLPSKYFSEGFMPFTFNNESSSVSCLMAVLTYVNAKLYQASKSCNDESSLLSPVSPDWIRLLHYLGTSAIYLLTLSTELLLHERERALALNKPLPSTEKLQEMEFKFRQDGAKLFARYEFDQEFVKVMLDRLCCSLQKCMQPVKPLMLSDQPNSVSIPSFGAKHVVLWFTDGPHEFSTWEFNLKSLKIEDVRFEVCSSSSKQVPETDDATFYYQDGRTMKFPRIFDEFVPRCDTMTELVNHDHQRLETLIHNGSEPQRFKELMAISSSCNENTNDVLAQVEEAMQMVVGISQSHGIPFDNIILGGFKNGGGMALTTAMMLGLKNVKVKGVVNLHGHFPAATIFAELLEQHKKAEFPPVTILMAQYDKVVAPLWGEVIARSLYASKRVPVDFATVEGITRDQWDFHVLRSSLCKYLNQAKEYL